jgi:hypothetical protein
MHWSEKELLDGLTAALGIVVAREVFNHLLLHKKRRGRKKKPEIGYRVLAREWEKFRARHSNSVDEEQIARRFLRMPKHQQMLKRVDLRIRSPDVLRNAVRRGRSAREAIRIKRAAAWQIMPTLSLDDVLHGRRKRLVTDIGLYKTIEAAILTGPKLNI